MKNGKIKEIPSSGDRQILSTKIQKINILEFVDHKPSSAGTQYWRHSLKAAKKNCACMRMAILYEHYTWNEETEFHVTFIC